jgi:hypothetical protein
VNSNQIITTIAILRSIGPSPINVDRSVFNMISGIYNINAIPRVNQTDKIGYKVASSNQLNFSNNKNVIQIQNKNNVINKKNIVAKTFAQKYFALKLKV